MAGSSLESLDLSVDVLKSLRREGYRTTVEVLSSTSGDLVRDTGLPEATVENLLKVVSRASVKSEIVSSALLSSDVCPRALRQERLMLCRDLGHDIPHNFILTRTITELFGASSSGKTQLCLQLAIQAQLPSENGGLGGKVAMICTEEHFPSKRFQQMVQAFKRAHPEHSSINFSDNLSLCHLPNLLQMMKCLTEVVPPLLQNDVKLLIIDSLAGIFRGEYDDNECQRRTSDISRLAITLWRLAQEYGIAIICTNQVSTVVDSISSDPSGNLVPVLGLVWSNAVTTRIKLTKTDRLVSYAGNPPSPLQHSKTVLRSLKTIFSSYLPNFIHHYIIHESGVIFVHNKNHSDFSL